MTILERAKKALGEGHCVFIAQAILMDERGNVSKERELGRGRRSYDAHALIDEFIKRKDRGEKFAYRIIREDVEMVLLPMAIRKQLSEQIQRRLAREKKLRMKDKGVR